MLHIEYSGCEGRIDDDSLWEIVSGHDYGAKHVWFDEGGEWFECPVYDADFRYLSGLLQHAESEACEANVEPESLLFQLVGYVKRRVW